MNYTWRETLIDLQNYINANSADICFAPGSTRIAEKVKPEFYSLFDTAREAVLHDRFERYLTEAAILSRNYVAVENKLCRNRRGASVPVCRDWINSRNMRWLPRLPGAARLDEIVLDKPLDEFLHEPQAALRRIIFDPLFGLLQGHLSPDAFEKAVDENIHASFLHFYHSGYAKWVGLNLVNQLKAGQFYGLGKKSVTSAELVKKKMRGAQLVDGLSSIDRTRSLNLSCRPEELCTILPVDVLLHSAKTKQYTGIKFGIKEAHFSAANVTSQRPCLSYESAKTCLGPDSVLIYVSSNIESAALVADHSRIWQPDMIIEIKEQSDLNTNVEMQKVEQCNRELRPPLGTFIILRPSVPGRHAPNLTGAIPVLDVGFDALNLEPLTSRLVPPARRGRRHNNH
jgi:hypothetical protein